MALARVQSEAGPQAAAESLADIRSYTPEQRAAAAANAPPLPYLPNPPTGWGAIADLPLLPLHAAAALLGSAAQGIGQAVGFLDLVNAGKALVSTDLEVSHVVGNDPGAAVELAGGAALVATGIASSVGLGLVGAGAKALASDVIQDMSAHGRAGTPPVSSAAPRSAPTASRGAVRETPRHGFHPLASLIAWARSHFHGARR